MALRSPEQSFHRNLFFTGNVNAHSIEKTQFRTASIMDDNPPNSPKFSRPMNKRKLILIIVISVLLLAVLIALLVHFLVPQKVKEDEPEEHTIEIQSGRIRGKQEGNAVAFKGIAYAMRPSGEKRWTPPTPCGRDTCWEGTFDASKFGEICAQQDLLNASGNPQNVIGSEDCLFINVWAPKRKTIQSLLPVLVFIHGGFLLYLSGNWKGLHPTSEMVFGMNVVGVSFNNRLNAFGFMALKQLADDSPSKTSGNYGFMDQILALRWVQTNIKKFGGDPDSVTLLGQSSGGTSELALLASPNATGLFHRAIILSASAIFNKSWDQAADDNAIFVKNANCTRNNSEAERACLYSLTPREIQDAIPWDEYPYWRMANLTDLPTKDMFEGVVAVVDGHVVPRPPLVSLSDGTANDVSLIFGTTAEEIDIAPVKTFSTFSEYEDHVYEKLTPFLGKRNVTEVLKMYNVTSPSGVLTPQYAYSSMVSDLRANCPNDVLARNASIGLNSTVYRFVVTNSPSKPVKIFGLNETFAFHMWDLVALFGFPDELNYKPSEKDKRFMKTLRDELGEFIHKGTVRNAQWKEYPHNTALFTDDGLEVKDGFHKKQCEFWQRNGFFSHAWIN